MLTNTVYRLVQRMRIIDRTGGELILAPGSRNIDGEYNSSQYTDDDMYIDDYQQMVSFFAVLIFCSHMHFLSPRYVYQNYWN